MTIIKEASTNDFSITASNKKAKDQVELLMKLMKIDAESKEDGGSTTYTMKVDADKLGKLKDASWTDGVKLSEKTLSEDLDYTNIDKYKNSILREISKKFDFVSEDVLDYDELDISKFKEDTSGSVLDKKIVYSARFSINSKNVDIGLVADIETSWKGSATSTTKTMAYAGKVDKKSLSGYFRF